MRSPIGLVPTRIDHEEFLQVPPFARHGTELQIKRFVVASRPSSDTVPIKIPHIRHYASPYFRIRPMACAADTAQRQIVAAFLPTAGNHPRVFSYLVMLILINT